MGSSVAADFADMRTPRNKWETVLENMKIDTLNEDILCT